VTRGEPPGDPFAVLGLSASATAAEVRDARRRLAFDLHPDRGGDLAAMQQLNAAVDACLAAIERARADAVERPAAAPRGPRHRRPVPRRPHVEHDLPSFTIDALPAEAFEALLVVASWIGEVVDDDPPYVLDCHLHDPVLCWCRLELVPDAGGSTVNLSVASAEAGVVSAEAVRDVWVENLNRLGGPLP
jgi:hypothetical protein